MKIRFTAILLTLVLVLTFAVGCSAGSKGDSMMSAPGAAGDSNTSAGGVDGKPTEDIKPGTSVGDYERKIIRTVTMSCESKAYDDAVTVIMDTLSAHGGYVESSSSSGTKAKSVASTETYAQARQVSYTFRIPAENLDAFLNALRTDDGIRILSQTMSSDEVTGSYYDIQTRLGTLTAEKNALTAMLESFTDYKDISGMLQVQERLYNVIEEMESLQTKLNLYDSQVAYSTVNLSLREVVEYTEVEEPTFGERIGEAFTESWKAFGEGCQDFAVWFVEALPTLLILAVFAAVGIAILLRIRRKRRASRQSDDPDQ